MRRFAGRRSGGHAVTKKVGPVIEKDDHVAAAKNADRDLVANLVQKPDRAPDQRGLSTRLRQQLKPHAVDVLGRLGWDCYVAVRPDDRHRRWRRGFLRTGNSGKQEQRKKSFHIYA